MIFDDFASCNLNIIKHLFSFGRLRNTDYFYLCQTYLAAAKNSIRDNVNLRILFSQEFSNSRHGYQNLINLDMPYDDFITYILFVRKIGTKLLQKVNPSPTEFSNKTEFNNETITAQYNSLMKTA